METIQNEPLNRCEEVLAHEGVKGMHWYIRRYQPYPSGYDGEGKFVGKRAARKAAKIEKRQARHQAKVKRNIEVAVNNGDQKAIEKLRDKIEPEEYNKLHDEAVANGIDQAIKERDLSQLRKYKKDIIPREYNHQKDRIEFKKAVDDDNSKKINKLLPKVDPEDVAEATNLIKSRVALQDQKLSKIRQDSELMAKMDKLASGLGKVSKVTSSVASISKSINDVNTTLSAFSKASEESKDKREKKAIERVVKSGDLEKIEQYKERMDYNQLKEAYGKAYVMNTRAIDTAIAKGNLDDVYAMLPWMDASDMSKVITKIKNLEDRGAAFSDDISYEDVLAHHGVLGMKWGVRRYQKMNGRLTPEGKKRYRSVRKNIRTEAGKLKALETNMRNKADIAAPAALKREQAKDFYEETLRKSSKRSIFDSRAKRENRAKELRVAEYNLEDATKAAERSKKNFDKSQKIYDMQLEKLKNEIESAKKDYGEFVNDLEFSDVELGETYSGKTYNDVTLWTKEIVNNYGFIKTADISETVMEMEKLLDEKLVG